MAVMQGPASDTTTAALESARRALARGDLAHAELQLDGLLAARPGDPAVLESAAELAHRRGDLPRLAELLERLHARCPERADLSIDRAMVLQRLGRDGDAAAVLQARLADAPAELSALLLLSTIRARRGEWLPAVGLAMRALDAALATTLPPPAADPPLHAALASARTLLRRRRADAIDAALQPLRERHGEAALARIQAGMDMFLGRRPLVFDHPQQRPAMMFIPGLVPRPFFEREEFPWLRQLEEAVPVIREEFLALQHEHDPAFAPYVQFPDGDPRASVWHEVNNSANWSAFHLYRHGTRVAANADRCPRTSALLESLPLMRIPDHAPEVLFSVLRPHARIPPHYGSINGRLIVHVPLIVPPRCGALQAAGEAREWEEGRCLVFDDSFEHLAWNDSEQTRVVMLVDLWNPQLTQPEREAFSAALVAVDRFHATALAAAGDPVVQSG